jgi:hypothetical protein
MIREVAKSQTPSDALTEFLTFLVVLLITTFLIRLLWNTSLVKHITILKPVDSLTDAFILSIALQVIYGL